MAKEILPSYGYSLPAMELQIALYKRRAKRDMGALKEGQRAFKRGHKIQKTDIVKRQAFGPDFFCRRSKHAGLSVYFKNALSARIKFP